jgi:hypothetical protein
MLSLGIYPVIVNLALSTAARSPHGITETKIKNYAIKMYVSDQITSGNKNMLKFVLTKRGHLSIHRGGHLSIH